MSDQKKHLYSQSGFGKVRWFVARFGASEVLFKPLRTTFASVIIPRLPLSEFTFKGEKLACFYHAYNMTWACERCVEVPVAQYFRSRFSVDKVLEVGNVLSHYGEVRHLILDKFEKAPGVVNADIVDFSTEKQFDLILSISTFEHIGFDDDSTDGSVPKIKQAVDCCRRLLSPGGTLLITVPIGYNPELDDAIEAGQLSARQVTFLGQVQRRVWKEVPQNEGMRMKYRSRFPYANAIAVLEFGSF